MTEGPHVIVSSCCLDGLGVELFGGLGTRGVEFRLGKTPANEYSQYD